MNKEEKVTSLELSKKIYELSKKKGIELPESEHFYLIVEDKYNTASEIVNFSRENRSGKYNDGTKWSEKFYNAYDTSELGEMLPDNVESYRRYNKWTCGEYRMTHWESADIEAEARGKMYFYLLDNNLL